MHCLACTPIALQLVSERLFSDLPIKDLVSWNTNIAAFARSGTLDRTLELFSRMLLCVLPNENTIASVLVACIRVNALCLGSTSMLKPSSTI